MRGCLALLTLAVSALAQEAPSAPAGATVPAGVPLRVALEHRVAIKRVGEPVQGRLVEPIYVFDRVVLPAGSVVEGHIAEIGGVPAGRRIAAILSGNFTPAREVRAQFDTLVLSDGSRLSLSTSPARGTAHTQRVVTKEKKKKGAGQDSEEAGLASIRAFTPPGEMLLLKSTLLGMLPYHRQAWPAGTLFNSVLQESLNAPPYSIEAQTGHLAVAQPADQEVSARLLTRITSATALRGDPVEATVTRPLFSPGHDLLIPEGSRLFGDVVKAQRARLLHRNGKVLFMFRQIQLPGGARQGIQGYLSGLEADFDAHLTIDSEGDTHVASPKTRFIFPAIAVAVAGLSFHQDINAQGVPDQDIGGRAESGAVGLGLIGTVLAQASRTLASSIAITGAGFSVYSNFITRGKNVVLPANTPVKISLKARGAEAGGWQR